MRAEARGADHVGDVVFQDPRFVGTLICFSSFVFGGAEPPPVKSSAQQKSGLCLEGPSGSGSADFSPIICFMGSFFFEALSFIFERDRS